MASALVACGSATSAAPPTTQVVTDISGARIRVPLTINRIAEQFPAHTATDIMLGVGPKLVAIPHNVKTLPFLRKVFPGIVNVPELFQNDGSVNMEDLLKLKPDVVSATSGGATLKPFEAAGLPAVDMDFNTYAQLTQSIQLAGQVYGGEAKKRAQQYLNYFNSVYNMVRSRTANLPADQRPTVVHIASYPPLVVDGGNSLIDEWISVGGGTDAASTAAGVKGTHVTVTIEQLLKWNPDVLILETPGGDQGIAAASGQSLLAQLQQTPGWQDLRAVQTGRVYLNPQGLYPWERFGPEEALQIQWIAQVLHPDLFRDLDMRTVARDFYRTFFNYTPTDAELNTIFQTTS